MNRISGRLLREQRTLVCMTQIYCRHHHGRQGGGLCPDCVELMQYAEKRLRKCPYGTDKPTCANCPIHCYKAAQREQVREIMRFAGPRMTWRHPLRSLTHLYDKLRQVEHPLKTRRTVNRRRGAADREQQP